MTGNKLLRTVKYLIQPGNLFWIAVLASWFTAETIWQVHYLLGGGEEKKFVFYIIIPTLIFISFQLAKTLDNAARISGGEADEPVPFGLFTRIPVRLPFRLLGGFILVGFIAGFVISLLRLPDGWTRQLLLFLPLFLLTPGIYRIALEEGRFLAIFKGRHWRAAIHDMGGIGRYVQVVVMPLILALATIFLFYFIVRPLLVSEESVKQHMMFSLLASGKVSLPWQLYVASLLEGVIIAFFNSMCGLYWAFFVPPQNDAAHEASASDFAELAKAIPAKRLTAMQAESIDPALLAEADTQAMTPEAQIDLSLALAQADRLLKEKQTDEAEAKLLPFVADDRDLASHFPAARRLYQLYREQGRTAEQHALQQRLLALLVQRKHDHAYRLLREELAHLDPATLPADWIYPIAQTAAQHHDHDLVLHLGKHFARRHPDHPHIIDNYFLAARSLDKQGHSRTALQLLDQLLARYPEHGKTSQIRHTRKLIAQKLDKAQSL